MSRIEKSKIKFQPNLRPKKAFTDGAPSPVKPAASTTKSPAVVSTSLPSIKPSEAHLIPEYAVASSSNTARAGLPPSIGALKPSTENTPSIRPLPSSRPPRVNPPTPSTSSSRAPPAVTQPPKSSPINLTRSERIIPTITTTSDEAEEPPQTVSNHDIDPSLLADLDSFLLPPLPELPDPSALTSFSNFDNTPISGFLLFMQEQSSIIDLTSAEDQATQYQNAWDNLSDEVRAAYDVRSSYSDQNLSFLSSAALGLAETDPSFSFTDLAEPVKPTSPYLLWQKQERRRIKDVEPELSAAQVRQRLKESWKSMTEEDKQPFVDQHSLMKANWEASHPDEEVTAPRKTRRKRSRSVSTLGAGDNADDQEDAEEEESEKEPLNPAEIRMADLCGRDLKVGRKTTRFSSLTKAQSRSKRARQDNEAPPVAERQESPPRAQRANSEESVQQEETAAYNDNAFAVQMRIVDGQMVIDESSLQVDRGSSARAAASNESGNNVYVEERDNERFVNSVTWSKHRRGERWTELETERFFECISQWGTDFEMISRLFPNRTRKQIKLKWNREEKLNPAKITKAMMKPTRVDLKAYGQAVGADLTTPFVEPVVNVKPIVEEEE